MIDYWLTPFIDYLFLRRALMATFAISLSCAPLGVLLILRRMSLMGDALSHAVLPGIAIGYLMAGLWLPALTLGGIIAGLCVVIISTFISRKTILEEDASFTGLFLVALALGILILSMSGGQMNIMHILFGSILSVDHLNLLFIGGISTFTVALLAITYRPLVYECFDALFMRSIGAKSHLYHFLLMILVVLNLVAACQAMGTLMALGMMMLPAIAARLWARKVWSLFLLAISIAIFSSYLGLVLSYHYNWPSGPTIVLVGGVIYLFSLARVSLHPQER